MLSKNNTHLSIQKQHRSVPYLEWGLMLSALAIPTGMTSTRSTLSPLATAAVEERPREGLKLTLVTGAEEGGRGRR